MKNNNKNKIKYLKISITRRVYILTVNQEFSDFRQNNSIFMGGKKKNPTFKT